MNVGDAVTLKDPKYRDVKLTVSSVNNERIGVQRKDNHGMIWTAYANIKELELDIEADKKE